MSILVNPATAMSRHGGEGDTETVTGEETDTSDFNSASEGEEVVVVVDAGSENGTPDTEETIVPEGETPASADSQVTEEPTEEASEEPAVTEGEQTEEAVETQNPEITEEPQPTETPEVTPETVIEPTPEPTKLPEETAEPEDEEEESDPEADVETAADWEEMFRDIELTGIWADDLVTLAETQVGYSESEKNFVKDDEDNKHGYTRYGAWYGDPYREWDSLFIMFNLYYAGITKLDFPYEADCEDWIESLKEAEMFREVNEYFPVKGDLVFADTDEDGEADHVLIVKAVEFNGEGRPENLIVIEGDSENTVKENKYDFYSPLIVGYGQLPENPANETAPQILTFTGTANRVDVTVEYEEDAFPAGTTMEVKAVWDRPVIDAINETVASDENVEVVRVQAVDIIFRDANGTEIEPAKPIKVTMKSRAVPEEASEKPVVVHVDDEMSSSVVDTTVPVDEPIGSKEAVTFEAGAFSVYAIVYTVDFSYEVNGKVYGFTLQGADTVSLRALIETLHVYEKDAEEADIANEELPEEVTVSEDSPLDRFMNEIEDVTFSDTSLLVPAFVEENATAGQIKRDLQLFPSYPLGLTQEEVLALNAKEYKEGDWILISMKPFSSIETLTVSMKNGNVFYITVTDEQNAPMVGDRVQTISNPAGTTIDLFDYWVVSQERIGRDGWGDLDQGQGAAEAGDGHVNGSGNNKGINSSTNDPDHGHALKFSPAWAGTVYNGNKIGTTGKAWESVNLDGKDGLNSYTGNGDPFQGIVQNTLSGGYPVLTKNQTIGSNGESLQYLFDSSPSAAHDGKASYPGVNQLLYVDPDGYYTYDSRDYAAAFDPSSKTFDVTKQTSDSSVTRGFWPFGLENYWSGMHINTQFSMPVNGEVLNPSNEYKPMQFEFSGDDDTWLYVDGVLVGDGGGIHNRTEIDINFKNGTVTVTGKKDSVHPGGFESVQYLDDIFRAAGKYNEADWEDIGDGSGHKRFMANTYHTFDMFYLERGGGESNLYIHYNLVSTADFTAHKSFHGTNEEDILERNQFKFEMIGLDGKYRSVWSESEGKYVLIPATEPDAGNTKAIMPMGGSESGAGTVESPYSNKHTTTQLSDGTTVGSHTYRTGVTEDGNVNFGSAEISSTDMSECDAGNSPVYRYIIREIVPDDAVNADGITWAQATDAQRKAGGFIKDDIIYDATVYYMTGRVTSWQETTPSGQYTRYGISKTYYTDDTYTTVRENTPFISFVNTYNAAHGHVGFTKVDQEKHPLAGATFALFKDAECKVPAKVIDEDNRPWVATSGADGVVSFEHVRTGTYYMKETAAPQGYALDKTIYKVEIEDEKDVTKSSKITIAGDETETAVTEIINVHNGEFSVVKKWLNSSGGEIDGGSNSVTVQVKRRRMVKASSTNVRSVAIQMTVEDGGVKSGPKYETTVVGDEIVIEWDDEWQRNFNWKLKIGEDSYEGWIGEEKVFGDGYRFEQIDVDGRSRRLTISKPGDVTFTTKYWVNWLHSDQNHWANLNNPQVFQGEDSSTYTAEEDNAFNDQHHTQELNGGNGWNHTWKIGGTESDYAGFDFPAVDSNGKSYLYYAAELDSEGNEVQIGKEVTGGFLLQGYSANNSTGVSDNGMIIVYNQSKEVQTISIDVKKSDENAKAEHPNFLAGAVFQLQYRQDETKQYVNVPNTVVHELDNSSQFTVPADGITLTGLIDAQYRLQEIRSPDGYVIETVCPVTLTVSGGRITSTDGTISSVNYTAASETAPAEFIIPNTPGTALPETGGFGTGMLSTLGGILILSAGYFLLRRNR